MPDRGRGCYYGILRPEADCPRPENTDSLPAGKEDFSSWEGKASSDQDARSCLIPFPAKGHSQEVQADYRTLKMGKIKKTLIEIIIPIIFSQIIMIGLMTGWVYLWLHVK